MAKNGFFTYFLIFLFTISFPLWADFGTLQLDVFCELEPFVTEENGSFPVTKETAVNRILEEARIIFSSMLYGYQFTYTPQDSARKVKDFFELTPIAQIKWGDPGLDVLDTYTENKRLYATVKYHLKDFQEARLTAWQTNSIPETGGLGSGDLFKGYKEKITAMEQAIKESIRGYLRKTVFNKPREIRGEVLVTESPKVIIKAGAYITEIKIKLNVLKIIPYKIF